MRIRKTILGGITLFALSSTGVRNLMAADPPDGHRQIAVELAKLRADVLVILAEMEQMKVEKLEAELNRVQQKQKELAAAEAQQREELAGLDQQLSSADLPEQTRPEVEAVRSGIVENMSGPARQEQFSLEKRQVELTDQVRQELQRFAAWKQQAQLLASSAAQ